MFDDNKSVRAGLGKTNNGFSEQLKIKTIGQVGDFVV
jgi:hypothetical protein